MKNYQELTEKIHSLLAEKQAVVVAIDGMCGAGKTTLANRLSEHFGCGVVRADDFYLPAELRTQERLSEPGGNIHYERFLAEVIKPLTVWKKDVVFSAPIKADVQAQGTAQQDKRDADLFLSYRRFSCHVMDYLSEPARVPLKSLVIVEGSYCMRPELRTAYDLTVFVECSEADQLERIKQRSGKEMLEMFRTRWIPMENRYFLYCAIRAAADEIYKT